MLTNGELSESSPGRPTAPVASARSAATAAARTSAAGLLLGLLGLASFGFALIRLRGDWHVSPHATSHHLSVLGQELSYPVANAAAVVVLVLALLGAIVTGIAVFGAGRELAASRRFGRHLLAVSSARVGDALVIEDDHTHAFCAGLLKPRVYVTSGALAILDRAALDAPLLHERHHARRRDPLRLATSHVLAQALFFLPALQDLSDRQQVLSEMSADESAINAAPENRSALARAMLGFRDSGHGDPLGIDPERVDHLLGEPPSWRFPTVLCLTAVAALALVVASAVLAGREATGSATLAPPFLSAQPCVVVLALIPSVIGLVAIRLARWPRLPPSA